MTLTPNIAAPIFNILFVAFLVVIALGAALGIYATKQLKKMEDQAKQ